VRLAVVCSILVHATLVVAGMRLPAARPASNRAISIEIQQTVRRPAPTIAATPPPATKPPKLAMREPVRERSQPREPEPLKPALPPQEAVKPPPPTPPTEPSKLSMRSNAPSAPVDLTLHSLPGTGIAVQPGALAGGEGGPAGTFGSSPPPRKQWHPRGSAGDPLLGKLDEEKQERFPLQSLGADGYAYDGPSFSAHIALDGTVDFDDKNIRDFKGLSGGFDVTDLLMKAKKQDPYRYEKEKFMEETASLRNKLRATQKRAQLERALASLPARLQAAWDDPARSARERRNVLYTMWREAAGTEEEVGPAGAQVRASVERFVREHLPEGSPDAFTPEELKRYANRPGPLKFNPYRSGGGERVERTPIN
jgi:hypothetical protein